MNQLMDGTLVVGPPRTEAGRRSVAIPPHIIPDLLDHLGRFVGPHREALMSTGEKGGLRALWELARAAKVVLMAREAHSSAR